MMLADSSCQVAVVAPMLPPCRICGEKASGFHYGANTCEACKGFFRRSLARKEEYKCAAEGSCEIEPGKRNACAACRYQKCLSVGMSKTAIKTGRYTHEKKTKDIEEVKRLQHQKRLKDEGKIAMTSEEREKELEKIIKHITAVHLQQTPHTPEFFEKLPEREAKFLERRALQEQMFGTMKPLPREEYRQIYQSTGIDIDGRREMITHMIPCIEKAIKRFISFAKALPGFKDLPIDDQIALIKASHFEYTMLHGSKSINLDKRLMTPLCNDRGFVLKLDDLMAIHEGDELYFEIQIRIASQIQALNLSDTEMALLCGATVLDPVSRFENWMVEMFRAFSVDKKIYFHPNDPSIVHLDDCERLALTEELGILCLKTAGRLQQLNLCDEEIALLRAIITMAPDRFIEILKPQKLQDSYDEILEAFMYLVMRNRPDQPLFFAHVASLMASMRTMGKMNTSRFESSFIETYQCFRIKSQIFLTAIHPNMAMDINEFGKYFNRDFVLDKFRMADRLQKLNLTTEENVVLKGAIILAPDRVIDLEAQEKVAEAQEVLIKALLYLFQMNHGDDPLFFAKVISVLVELRSMNVRNFQEEERFHMDFDDIKWPQLFMEFIPDISLNSDLFLPQSQINGMISEIPELDIEFNFPEDGLRNDSDGNALKTQQNAAEIQQSDVLSPIQEVSSGDCNSSSSDHALLTEKENELQAPVLTELQSVSMVSSSTTDEPCQT